MQHFRHFFQRETYFIAIPHSVGCQFVNIHPITEPGPPGVATLPFSGTLPSLHTWLQLQPISQCFASPLSTVDPSSGDSNKGSRTTAVINAMSLWKQIRGHPNVPGHTLWSPQSAPLLFHLAYTSLLDPVSMHTEQPWR